MAKIEACRFSGFQEGNIRRACVIVGGVAILGSCHFETSGTPNDCEGIWVKGSGAGPVAILSNRFKQTFKLITIDSPASDCIVFPQYDETSGTISLPTPNNGMLAVPHIARGGSNVVTGLIVPSTNGDPTQTPREGMISYNSSMHKLRAFLNGQWRTVSTT